MHSQTEQVWKAIQHYDSRLDSASILMGDFNSNAIWNKQHRKWSHSDVVTFLEKKGIVSSYHQHYNLEQGKEQHPTHYLYRHQARGFHIDYCFVSNDLYKKIERIEIGDYARWKPYSDHVPLMVTFKPKSLSF